MSHRATGLLIILGAALLAACTSESSIFRASLCDPELEALEAASDLSLPPPSTDGASLVLYGRFLWDYASTDSVLASPAPGEPTLTPAPNDYVLYDLKVRVGTQDASVLRAFERTVYPYVSYTDLDGTTKNSDCLSCTTCVAENEYGCGNCDLACSGCEQVIELEVPPLTAADGVLEGTQLVATLVSFSSLGQSPAQPFGFPLACQDGADNDGDGLIDGEDPECISSGWTELDP